MSLDKNYYRDQRAFQYRELQKVCSLIGLSNEQQREIMRIVDEIVGLTHREGEAPTPPNKKGE